MKFVVLVLITLGILATGALAQPSKASDEIRKVMNAQAAAWNRGDLEEFMAGYWRSEELVFVSGDRITRGWQQTLDNYKRTYSSKALMGMLSFTDLEIKVLSSDAALVLGSWSLAREKDNPKGKFTLLFRKFKTGWKVVHDHTS